MRGFFRRRTSQYPRGILASLLDPFLNLFFLFKQPFNPRRNLASSRETEDRCRRTRSFTLYQFIQPIFHYSIIPVFQYSHLPLFHIFLSPSRSPSPVVSELAKWKNFEKKGKASTTCSSAKNTVNLNYLGITKS